MRINDLAIRTEQCEYLMGPQPRVSLLHATPEWVVAQATKGYTGVYSMYPMSQAEQDKFWNELGKTKLKGPLEFAVTSWLIEDVTRAFTHQLARYRLGTAMVQESQRFSRQSGTKARIMVPQNIVLNNMLVEEFIQTCEQSLTLYNSLIEQGANVQDARALLPTHICTRLYLSINMKALAHVYDQRMCCQAQEGEWASVIGQMRDELDGEAEDGSGGFSHYAATLQAPWEDPTCVSCGFGASFDRPCRNQHLFDANLLTLASVCEENRL